MILDTFKIDGRYVSLLHNINDDSRSVMEGETELLNINSSLHVTRKGERIGTMTGYGNNNWEFISSVDSIPNFTTSQPVGNYHWRQLEKAEVEVAQHILSQC